MIVKLTSSLKGVQIIDDDGKVFQTSVFALKSLLEGDNKKFVICSKMPYDVSPDRFPKSPVYGGYTTIDAEKYDQRVLAKDALAYAHREKRDEEKPVKDAVVKWD